MIVFAQPFESDKKLNTGAAMQSIHLEVAELAIILSQMSPNTTMMMAFQNRVSDCQKALYRGKPLLLGEQGVHKYKMWFSGAWSLQYVSRKHPKPQRQKNCACRANYGFFLTRPSKRRFWQGVSFVFVITPKLFGYR